VNTVPAFFICCQAGNFKEFFLRSKKMTSALKLPTINQLISMAIAIVLLFFVIRMLPEQVKTWFRV